MTTPVEPASAELIAEIEGVETLAEGSAPTDHIIVVAGVLAYVFASLRAAEARANEAEALVQAMEYSDGDAAHWRGLCEHAVSRAIAAETALAAAQAEIERLREAEPSDVHQQSEERLCTCGAVGSGEGHTDGCDWQSSEWRKWGHGYDAIFGTTSDSIVSTLRESLAAMHIGYQSAWKRAGTAEMTNEELTSKLHLKEPHDD